MADIFRSEDACRLLKKKFIYLIGDSNMRSFYLDLLYLLKEGGITPAHVFRKGGPGKSSYCGDKLVDVSTSAAHGRNFFEIRQYQDDNVIIRYCYITRVYSNLVKRELKDIEKGVLSVPDVVIVNSCLWDITRWGAMREDKYKQEMVDLVHHLQCLLPDDTLIIWTTTLPVSTEKVKGGVFIKQLEFMTHSMRFMIMEANKFAQQLCMAFDIDLLDLHYHMCFQLHRRTNDGLHWEPPALRHITNLMLTHIALCWEKPLPGNFVGSYVRSAISRITEGTLEDKEKVQLDQEILQYIQKKSQEKTLNKITRVSPGNGVNDHVKGKPNDEANTRAETRKHRSAARKKRPFKSCNRNESDKRARTSVSVAPSLLPPLMEVSGFHGQKENSVIGLRETTENRREFSSVFGHAGAQSGREEAQYVRARAQSGYNMGQLGYNMGQPGYNMGQLGYNMGQPGYNMAQPGYNMAQSDYNMPHFGYARTQNDYNMAHSSPQNDYNMAHSSPQNDYNMAHSSHNGSPSYHDEVQSARDLAQHYANRIRDALESENSVDHCRGGSRPATHYNIQRENCGNVYQQNQEHPSLMGEYHSRQNRFQTNNSVHDNTHNQFQGMHHQAGVGEWSYQQQHIQPPQEFWSNYPTSNFPWNWRR
nr:uncharacterized protein LOC123758274 [Procambarus clarkii]